MKKLGNSGNQELFEAMQLQETLIGNLRKDEVRMLEQYRALNRELSRRAQLGDAGVAAETSATASAEEHGTTAGTVETAVARHRERVKEESVDREGSRELSPPGRRSTGTVAESRTPGNRVRSRSQRSLSPARERPGTEASRSLTKSPRDVGTRNKNSEGTPSRKKSSGNTGNLSVSRCQYPDVRLTERGRTGNRGRPEVPPRTVDPTRAPVDLEGREPNASTVFVGNISRECSELEVLELFNSADGVFENRERNIIVACNFAYREGNLQGQAYFLYSTVALANFVVNRLHNRELRRRSLYVKISDCRLNTTNLSRRGNYLGRSRSGESIWDCPEAPRSRQQE